jgi:hypothetical protein
MFALMCGLTIARRGSVALRFVTPGYMPGVSILPARANPYVIGIAWIGILFEVWSRECPIDHSDRSPR